MTVLLTGASGFLGRHVLRLVVQAGYKAVVFGRRFPECLESQNIQFIGGEISSGLGMDDIPWDKVDRIIHLAASGVKASRRTWADCVNVNVVGTQRLLTHLTRSASRQPSLFFARTFYEKALTGAPGLSENPYVVTKAAATEMVRMWSKEYLGAVMLGSIFQIYGPGDDRDSVLSYVARTLKASRPCSLGSGRNLRDWLYIEDAAHAIMAAISAPAMGLAEYDIGSGVLRSIAEMVHELAGVAGSDARLVEYNPAHDRNDLGIEIPANHFPPNWRPQTSISEGLGRLYESS